MGLTRYPHGISSMGVPLIGSGGSGQRFYGWWGANSWFVDNDNGSDDAKGDQPTNAFKNLAQAISKCSANDVIYIRPAAVSLSATDPTEITPASATNWLIPRAKYNVAVIGAGTVHGMGQIHQTYLRGHASVTGASLGDSCFTTQAPYTSLENLAFHRGGSTRATVEFYGDGTAANSSWGCSAYNCLFRFHNNSSFGALHILDSWYASVQNSHFYRCQIGVMARGLQSTVREVNIIGNIFDGDTADLDCCILISGSETRWVNIYNNFFNTAEPAKSSGSFGTYITFTGSLETGSASMVANNFAAVADWTAGLTLDGAITSGNYDGGEHV